MASCTDCDLNFDSHWAQYEHIHSYSHHRQSVSNKRTYHACLACKGKFHMLTEYADHISRDSHKTALQTSIEKMKKSVDIAKSDRNWSAAGKGRSTPPLHNKPRGGGRHTERGRWSGRGGRGGRELRGHGRQYPHSHPHSRFHWPGPSPPLYKPHYAQQFPSSNKSQAYQVDNEWNRSLGFEFPGYQQPSNRWNQSGQGYCDFDQLMPASDGEMGKPSTSGGSCEGNGHNNISPEMKLLGSRNNFGKSIEPGQLPQDQAYISNPGIDSKQTNAVSSNKDESTETELKLGNNRKVSHTAIQKSILPMATTTAPADTTTKLRPADDSPMRKTAKKSSSLKGLVSGQAGRRMQHELDKAVKERRQPGRRFEISAKPELGEHVTLEQVNTEDLDEVAAVLDGEVEDVAETNKSEPKPKHKVSKRKASLKGEKSKPEKKLKVQKTPNSTTKKVTKKVQVKRPPKHSSAQIVIPNTMSNQKNHTNAPKLQSMKEPKAVSAGESKLQELLHISEREEVVRSSLSEQKPLLENLLKEQEILNSKVGKIRAEVQALEKEETLLRTSRLNILRGVATGWNSIAPTISKAELDFFNDKETAVVKEKKEVPAVVIKESPSSIAQQRRKAAGEKALKPSGLSVGEELVERVSSVANNLDLQQSSSLLYFSGHKAPITQLTTGHCLTVYEGHKQAVKAFKVLGNRYDDKQLCSVGLDGKLLCFNAETGVKTKSHDLHSSIMCMIDAWGLLIMGLESGDIVTYNIESSSIAERYTTRDSGISCLAASSEGARRILIVAAYDNSISVRCLKSGLLLKTVSRQELEIPRRMETDLAAGCLYVAVSNKVKVFSLETFQLKTTMHSGSAIGKVKDMCLSTDECRIMTALDDGTVCQFDTKTMDLINCYHGETATMLVAITSIGHMAFTGDRYGMIKGYPISTNRIFCKLDSCTEVFGERDHLVHHVFSSHMLTQILQTRKCPWPGCLSQIEFSNVDILKHHILTRHTDPS